ncbi:MAG: hypothetical protein SFW66_05930 [Gammaproteobacteria bacterium]|nr:hypothetical protein [Gammaproteobacteria bacterium]
MKRTLTIFFIVFLTTQLTACAELTAQYNTTHCTTNAAYAAGVNAATSGNEMETTYDSLCSENSDALNNAYQNGYKYGLAHQPTSVKTKVIVYNGNHPDKQCVSDSFGNQTCGYNCAKTPFQIQCAKDPENNCVSNVFNDIKCGSNCHVDQFNQINCDSTE